MKKLSILLYFILTSYIWSASYYLASTGAGRTADLSGNLMASFTKSTINNSLVTTSTPPRAGRKGRGANKADALSR